MLDVCAIGTAGVDIVARVDDAFLERWNLPKSICSKMDFDQMQAIISVLPDARYYPGGCGANVAAGVAALGGKAGFFGKSAPDFMGDLFAEDMRVRGVYASFAIDTNDGAASTQIFALTTPDSERTFANFHGLKEDILPSDIDVPLIGQSRIVYLDGYVLNTAHGGESLLYAARAAKAAGRTIAFSPNDISVLTNHPHYAREIEAMADIILCNQQEAFFMAETQDTLEAIRHLKGLYSQGSVTVGEHGAYVFDRDNIHHVAPSAPPSPVTDTNGAGDAFAGGLLYGLSQHWDLSRAAALGNRCAAVIITMTGARPPARYGFGDV